MKREDIPFLWQLVTALEEAGIRLEEFYKRKDYAKFEKTKKFMIQIQKKIAEITEK